LTQRLLGFSRKQVFEPKILNVHAVVSEISKMLPTPLGAHVDFSLDLHGNAGYVNADPIQMEQVLINLAVNSRDAMPKGGKLMINTAARELERRKRRAVGGGARKIRGNLRAGFWVRDRQGNGSPYIRAIFHDER
jgi:signal transduction histidine kinase